MANSYENTIMPEKPVEQIKPDAIPVDDKGQPLPDPTENLSSYIAPKGVEELRKAYSEVEVDEDVRKTMEPPQKTGFLRKHRPGKRGYDYYGTPVGSVPNDSNGLKPSPLSELFSEAEALEPDFDLDKIREHVLQQTPEAGSEYRVVETPKLDSSAVKNPNGADGISDDGLKKPEVIKDPNAPKFLELYKESTNTRVIFQSDVQGDEESRQSKAADEAQQIFAEHSQVTKVKKRINKREEKKAIKAAIKAEKKAAKERRKAEKAARKAAKKAARKGITLESPAATSPDEIIKLREETAEKTEEEILQNTAAESVENTADKKIETSEHQKEEARLAEETARAAREEAEKAVTEKAEAEKQLEIANRQKEEAELEAQRTAQEAEKQLKKEKEALQKQKKETKTAQKERVEALIKLDEEKAAAKKAAKEAKSAREEAERLKAELEAMKEAAAQALAQKQEAEEAARIAREEKEKLGDQMRALEQKAAEKSSPVKAEETDDAVSQDKHEQEKETTEKAAEELPELNETDEKPIIKSVMEKYRSEKKNAEEKAISEITSESEPNRKKYKKNESGDIYMNSPTMEVIKRRIAEMEAQLSSENSDVK